MLKYKGKDSKVLTLLVGVAKLAADLGKLLGWNPCCVVHYEHPSDQVLAILQSFDCFDPFDPNDPLVVEFGNEANPARTDIIGILRTVRDMPEYTEILTAGIRSDCFE